jgi:hypothetical protein
MAETFSSVSSHIWDNVMQGANTGLGRGDAVRPSSSTKGRNATAERLNVQLPFKEIKLAAATTWLLHCHIS